MTSSLKTMTSSLKTMTSADDARVFGFAARGRTNAVFTAGSGASFRTVERSVGAGGALRGTVGLRPPAGD